MKVLHQYLCGVCSEDLGLTMVKLIVLAAVKLSRLDLEDIKKTQNTNWMT